MTVRMLTGRTMAQAVSRRPPTAEARVHVRVNPCGICVEQSGTGTGFSSSSSVFLVSIIPPGLHIYISFGGSSSETVSPHKFKIKKEATRTTQIHVRNVLSQSVAFAQGVERAVLSVGEDKDL
jgi:hypothetical protein